MKIQKYNFVVAPENPPLVVPDGLPGGVLVVARLLCLIVCLVCLAVPDGVPGYACCA